MSDQDNKDNPADQAKPLFSIGTREYDIDSAVNKITNADNHIANLETETAGYKQKIEELEAKLEQQGDLSAKLDAALEKLGTVKDAPAGPTDSATLESLKAKILEEAVHASTGVVTEFEKQKIAQANTVANIELAKKKFGTEYETKLREEGKLLGYSDEDIQKLAAGDSERFKRLFGLDVSAKPSEVSHQGGGYRPSHEPVITDLPSPVDAWNNAGRVDAVQQRLKAKLKEKGIN